MIVVDIETSGLDFEKSGIWQIGAIELENPDNSFLEEARIDETDSINPDSLKIIGKTEEELRDKNKQSQKELLQNFFDWALQIQVKDCICQNPQFDWSFLCIKAMKYKLDFPFIHRAYDLHSIAQLKYFQLKKRFLLKKNITDMGLSKILIFIGMQDTRKEHNALEDAKLTAECFSRIVYGKNLIDLYNRFDIPPYLKENFRTNK
jgi:DNA polymerase III epsilon subunit-like protein